jgi:hypothetical protein
VHAELEGVICSGPQRGKRLTYALLAARAPRAQRLSRDEALGRLAGRYFRSHGPATIRDFVWWSGLASADAKRGLDISNARPEVIDGRTYWTLSRTAPGRTHGARVHLLPIYDEYFVAYRDRDAVPGMAGARGAATLQPALIVAGRVVGTWKSARNADGLLVDVAVRRRLGRTELRALDETAARYGRFWNMPVSLSLA